MSKLKNANKVNKTTLNLQQEESFITNAATFFEATSNNFSLMARAHFRGSSFFLGNIFIPLLVTFGVSALMAMTFGFAWILFITMTFSGLATYGTVFFTIRKSSIMKNINLTSTESATLYTSTFLLIGVSLSITMIIVLFFCWFLDVVGFTAHEFEFYNHGNPAGMWYIEWKTLITDPTVVYYWIEQIVLCFSLSFFVEKVVATQKNFFIFVFVYILTGLFFGGLMASTLYVDASGNVQIITDDTTLEELGGVAQMKPYLWGTSGWKVSQLFPHFGANQIVMNASQASAYQYDFNILDDGTYEIFENSIIYNKWYNLNIFTSIDSWQVDYYLVSPWAWCALLLWISAMIERFDKNKRN